MCIVLYRTGEFSGVCGRVAIDRPRRLLLFGRFKQIPQELRHLPDPKNDPNPRVQDLRKNEGSIKLNLPAAAQRYVSIVAR